MVKHNSNKYSGVLVTLAMLCVMTCLAASIDDVCMALKAVSIPPTSQQHFTKPDALLGVDISSALDLAWVSPKDCQAGSKTYSNPNSEWGKAPELCLSIVGDENPQCSEGKTRAVIEATLADDNSFTVSAKLELSFTLHLSSGNVPVTGEIGFELKDIPATLLGRTVPVWTGNLYGSANGHTVVDSNLFDGVYAKLYDAGEGGEPSASTVEAIETIAKFSTDVAARVKFFEVVPSALEGDLTARMAFPDSLSLMKVEAKDVKMLGTSIAYATASASCDDDTCGQAMGRVLKNFAESEGKCGEATLKHITGSLSAIVSANLDTGRHSVISSRAYVQGSLDCSNQGQVLITLEALSDKSGADNEYDTEVFVTDEHAAVTMTKTIGMTFSGSRVAAVGMSGSNLYTTLEGDLFGNGRGGVFVDDVVITESTKTVFVKAVGDFVTALQTGRTGLDTAVYNHIMKTDPETVFDNYFARTATPTGHGLWQYWSHQMNGIDIMVDESESRSGLVANVDMTLRSAPLKFNAQDPAFTSMNSVLASMHRDLKGGDKNLTVPTLDAGTTYSQSKIDGAVSARIPIPKFTSGMRIRADSQADSWALATVVATFGSQCTLTDAHLTLLIGKDISEDTPVIESATKNSAIGGGYVARSASGTIINDDVWDAATLHAIGKSLGAVVTSVNKSLATCVQQLRLVCESSDVTYGDVVAEVKNIFESVANSSKSVSGIITEIQKELGILVDRVNSYPLIAHFGIVPDHNAGTVDFVFDIFSIRHFTSDADSAEWKRTIPLPRLAVQTPATTSLYFKGVSNGDGVLSTFTTKGQSSVAGWTLPVRSGMRHGLVNGTASLSINFPDSAKLIIDLSGKIERGSNVEGHFEGNMTVHLDESSQVLPSDFFNWTFNELNRGDYAQAVQPEDVVHSFFDNGMVMSSVPKYRLASPVPPFATALSDFFDISNMWDTERAYFYTDTSSSPVIASASMKFPTNAFNDGYNFTINGDIIKSCEVSMPNLTEDTAEKAFVDAIQQCEMAKYVRVEYVPNSDSSITNEGDVEVGRMVFYPATPGMVYSFVISTDPDTLSPLKPQRWSAGQTLPDALSWNDFYDSVYATFFRDTGVEYKLPEIQSISLDDLDLINASRREYYPNAIPGMLFPISFHLSSVADAVPIKSSLESKNLSAHFDITEENFAMPVAVDGEVSAYFGFAFWCSLGDGSLNMSTAFSDVDASFDNVVVPDAPNNTFTITFQYETRFKSDVGATPPLTNFRQTVALTPGELVGAELLKLVSLITDEKIKDMIVVDTVTDYYREPVLTQVALMFMPYVDPAAGSIDVPLSVTIDKSDIPYWGNGENAVISSTLTTCAINKDFATRFNVRTNPATNDDARAACTGVTGVVAANGTATLASNQVFVASSKNSYEFQANLISSVVDQNLFSTFFDSSADVDTTFDISEFKFAVDHVVPTDLSSQIMRFVSNVSSITFDALSQLADAKFDTEVITKGASAMLLKSLSSSDRSHLCLALQLANNASKSFSSDPASEESLPMVDSSVAPLFQQRLGDLLDTVAESVCDDSGELTLDPLCLTLSKGWGVQACADISIEDKALAVYIKAEPPVFKVDAGFKFDINKLIPGLKKNYSAGFGGDGDFVLTANTSASFGIRLDFVDDSSLEGTENALVDKWAIKVSLDPAHTKFGAAAALDANAQLKASFGSVVLSFASANVHLDAHFDASLAAGNKIDMNVDGSASLKAGVSLEPIFSCNIEATVASLADFIYGRGKPVWSDSCGSGESFIEALDALLEDMDFARFFEQDPSLFWKQFSKGLDNIFDQLITQLLDRAVAFIGKQLQGLVHKALDSITGPDAAEAVGKEIAEMVAHIILNHTAPTGEELERIVLTVFTGIMNKQFAPILRQPIPVPEPNPKDGRYVWQMRFGQVTTKPLTNINFHLGGHGLVQFGVQCQPDLQLDWSVSFDMIWTKGSGISIEWPVTPAFGGKVTISNNGLCEMEGRILFLGAVISANLKCDVALQVVPNEQKKLQALEFYADASIDGEAQIGLVGILGQKVDENIKNSLPALPHVKVGLLMSWGVDLRTDHKGQDTPSKFEFHDPKLCLGTLLTKFLKRITDQIYKIIRPLLPIFGKDGILLKKIDVLKPFLGSHNDLLGIIELMCQFFSGSCNVDSVRKLCDVIREVSDVLDKLQQFQQWLSGDPEGCATFTAVYNAFHIDWTKDDPQPENIPNADGIIVGDYDDNGHFEFNGLSGDQQKELSTWTSGWQTGGEFKFTLDVMQHFPMKLIQILLGVNTPLFSFSFPYASFGFSASWSIPVWPFPYVEIVIEARAAIEFHPPPIALMSNAVVDTIRTHNPSHIFRNFAVRSLQDGKPFFFINGYVEFGGGAGVGLSIFLVSITGEATISVRFEAGIAVVSINNEEWTTFDQIAMQLRTQGLKGTVDIELKFSGTFRIALKGCIHYIFGKKCWTIASKSWSLTFGQWSIKPKTLSSVSSTDGLINGDAANEYVPSDDPSESFIPGDIHERDSEYARFTITPTDVMLLARTQSDADAPRQRQLSSNPSIRFSGDVCKGKISVSVVGDINFPIQLPGCGDALLNVSQNNYETSGSTFSLTSNSIIAGDRPPMTFSGDWGRVVLSEADLGTTYDVAGKPACPVTIETGELSTLSLHGSPSDYGKNAIEFTGSLQETSATVLCSDFHINLDHFNCTSKFVDGLVDVYTPSVMSSFSAVASTPAESVFHIHATPQGRSVTLTSATSYTNFSVPDYAEIKGYTEVIGNSAGQMYLLSTMRTRKESPATVRLTLSSAEFDNGDGVSHVVHHTNVPYREYDIHGAEDQSTDTIVMPTTEFDVLTMRMHSKANSNMTHYISGCHVRSGIQMTLDATDDSYQTVVFGDKQGLKSAACSPSVISLSNKVRSHIVVNAGLDDRQLRWEFRPGKFTVGSLDSQSDMLQILHNNINRITVNFAPQSSDVYVNTQLGATDLVFNFPETDGPVSNKLTISGSPASILVNGPVDVIYVGTQSDSNYKTPFSKIGGVLAVSHDTSIILDSSKSSKVVNHVFRMNSLCLVDAVGQNTSIWKGVSSWIRDEIKASGMQLPAEGAECSLLYNSNAKQSLEIHTGSGADSFSADGAKIPVSLDLGANADNVTLKNTNGVKFSVDLGAGSDRLVIESTGDVDADLGDDKNTDVVNVYYKDESPNVMGTTIYPVGDNNAKLTLNHWLQQDLISVVRDSDKRSLNNRFRAGKTVQINATVSSILTYEQDSDTTYLIVGCVNMAIVSFNVHSSTSTSIAKNSNVYVNMNDVSARCTVNVNSETKANGAVGILIPDGMFDPPTVMRLEQSNDPVGTGTFTFGSLLISPTNVSHFEISIPPIPSLSREGTINVIDVPANADLLISAPGVEWDVNIASLHSTAVILDAEVSIAESVIMNKIPVIVAGNSKTSLVHVDGNKAQAIYYVSGCLFTESGQRGYPVSDWIVERTLDTYNVSIGSSHTCNVETMNATAVYINNCSTLGIGGLSGDYTNQVYISAANVSLTVDPDAGSSQQQQIYGDWKNVKFYGFSNGTSRFVAKRDSGNVFAIDVIGANYLSVNRGLPKLVTGSTLEIDCSETTANTMINLYDDYSQEIQVRSVLYVESEKCNALINNMISHNTSITPAVVLGHGLKLNYSLTMLPPYVPDNVPSVADVHATSYCVRSLNILANTTTNRTSYLLYEKSANNVTKNLVNMEWDTDFTEAVQHDLLDTAAYTLNFDGNVIDSDLIRMNVSAGSMLSFGDLHSSTVLFVSAKTSTFTPEKRHFSLTPSNRSEDYCFDPCMDCTEGAWGRVVISGKICQPRSAQDSCKQRAKVTINITGKLEGVSCGAASYDNERNETCAFAMNYGGHENNVLTVPDDVMAITTVIISLTIVLTIVGASSVIGRLVFACKDYATINIWWTHNTFRDLLTDQFSWAAIVITACLPEVNDLDYAQWGGWVVAIMMRAKTFVLNWFVACSDDGEPVWVTPATIVFWCVTLITVILRIVELILSKKEVELSSPVRNTYLAIQSVLTVTGFLLMPLVGYSLAFLNSTSYAGFVSVLCLVLLFLSQPVGSFSRSCITGIVASALNVLIPVGLCIFVGVGANFLPLVIASLCCTVVLPIMDIVVLWFAFFRKAVIHDAAWKHSIGWTISLRIVSMLCGIGFLVLLFFNLSDTLTKVAAGLWFAWVCIPYLAVIPLTAGVPSVLSGTEVVNPHKLMSSGNGSVIDEGSPLLGNIHNSESPDAL